MKLLKIIFHFLGSVYLAIALISICALLVVGGTFLESSTDSHLLAAQWTYHHPFFGLLLWLFFINILFAALRRWPFKWKHVPFLITHFGLLMIFGGAILKNRIGLQGHLDIWEGTGNQQILLPHTHALHVEKRNEVEFVNIPLQLDQKQLTYRSKKLPEVTFKITAFCPHVQDKLETWIKGHSAYISGHPPIEVKYWQVLDPIKFEQLHLEKTSSLWNVGAFRTDHLLALIQKAYLSGLNLHIVSKIDQETLDLPLENYLDRPISFNGGMLKISLLLPYSTIHAFEKPQLVVHWQSEFSNEIEVIAIALKGDHALYNILQTESWIDTSRFNIDLKRDLPTCLLVEDQYEDIHICFFDSHGRVDASNFCQNNLDCLVVYDEGFGGYAVQAPIPFPNLPSSRQDKEKASGKILAQEIYEAADQSTQLSPPLALFKNACDKAKVNFADAFIDFLSLWQQSYQLLFPNIEINSPLKEVLEHINWQEIALLDKQACQWVCLLFGRLEEAIYQGKNLIDFLETNKWPLVNELKQLQISNKRADLLTQLSRQIFSISFQMPHPGRNMPLTLEENAKLLSAYLKAYDIDYRILNPPMLDGEEDFGKLLVLNGENNGIPINTAKVLETPLCIRYFPQNPPKKIEDRHACVLIEAQMGSQTERLALAYQSGGNGLKWPLFNGEYVIRFQPQMIEIPYRLRLREAREIHYPNTQQPYSYESDVLIAQNNDSFIEKTLSMNHVHETWDGYRFYLAGMNSLPSGIKRVQIVVNHDPAKYLLTYPGAMILCLGIILLFWLKPYRKYL
jgi:hypothetical protein